LNVFAVVGVPLIVAVKPLPFSNSPSGNAPDETVHVQHVGGTTSSLALSAWLYPGLIFASPFGNDVVVMVGCPDAPAASASISASAPANLSHRTVRFAIMTGSA
jgi:hypothetical protein